MDIFEQYIKEHKADENCRALVCNSYKKFYENEHHKSFTEKTNTELATYGDALLKFTLCEIMLDNFAKLSESKKKFEEDKFLIETVAKHYNLLNYIFFDRNDKNIPQEYKFDNDKTKYIATTVEAVLGALYHDKVCQFEDIIKLVDSWIGFDKAKT